MDDPIPHPVLFNTWKHHAAWARYRINRAVAGGPHGVAALPTELLVVGTRLMDVYTGTYTPAEVGRQLLARLDHRGFADYDSLAAWLGTQNHWATLDLPDGSVWALRLGPAGGRYVHLHPGRWSPHTVRATANTIKSAVMAVAVGRLTGRAPLSLDVVNEARTQYLGMLPVRELTADAGLGSAVRLLDLRLDDRTT